MTLSQPSIDVALMKKKYISSCVLALLASVAPAFVQAQTTHDDDLYLHDEACAGTHHVVTHTVTQPSGEQVTLRRVSDEHHIFWVTADGAPTWYDESTRTLRYAHLRPDLILQQTATAVTAASSPASRQAAATMRYWSEPIETRTAATQSTAVLRAMGTPRIPVVLVEFADSAFQSFNTRQAIDSMLNAEDYAYRNSNGSVRSYFKAQSDGQFVPQFDVYGPYRLSQPMAYYGGNQGSALDTRWHDMVKQGIDSAIAAGADFSVYKDEQNSIPTVAVIFAGQGEHVSGAAFGHRLYPRMLGQVFTAGGFTFRSKFTSDEAYYNNAGVAYRAGTGTFIHEFSHVLGLPDFYDTSARPQGYGMDIWSVMDLGMHYSNRYRPIGYTAYEREFMGWLQIPALEQAAEVTLAPLHESGAAQRAVKIVNPHNANEYFVLENRQASSWFPSRLGQGLMITHVNYDAAAWRNNAVNRNQDRQRMYVVTADNAQIGYSEALTRLQNGETADSAFNNLVNDFFPGVGQDYTSFSATSPRQMLVYNSDGNGTLGVLNKPIYNIRINPDNTVFFAYLDSTLTDIQTITHTLPATPTHIYTLSGVRVATLPAEAPMAMPALPKGIYIRVSGTQRDKIFVE